MLILSILAIVTWLLVFLIILAIILWFSIIFISIALLIFLIARLGNYFNSKKTN